MQKSYQQLNINGLSTPIIRHRVGGSQDCRKESSPPLTNTPTSEKQPSTKKELNLPKKILYN